MRASGYRLAWVLMIGLLACRGPRPLAVQTVPSSSVKAPGLRTNGLGTEDLLEVRVFQEPDLSGVFRVSPEGTVDFPLCGKVTVSGLTASGIADSLTACLAHGYLKHPNVTVLVRELNSKKIFVLGEVQKPGTYPCDESMSIIQAVTLAGGFTKTAAANDTTVSRVVEGKEMHIRVPVGDIGVGREKNFELLPGDIVNVPTSFF